MKGIWDTAWHRFNIISSIVSDTNARVIALILYFTVVLPFGIVSTLFNDPLHIKGKAAWLDRTPIPTDLESAQEQG